MTRALSRPKIKNIQELNINVRLENTREACAWLLDCIDNKMGSRGKFPGTVAVQRIYEGVSI